MGDSFPTYPADVAGGDEPTHAPTKGDRSLLAAERGTQQTRRLETDPDNNLYVNVASGTITATIGEVEVKNDAGNPIPVSDAGGSITVDGTVAVSNLPVVQPVSDNGGSLTVDGTVAVSNFPSTQDVRLVNCSQAFWRIKNKIFLDTEEVRYDIPLVLTSAFVYVGLNTAGTATSSATWTIVRTSFDINANPNRDQIRTSVAWDSRTVGWT